MATLPSTIASVGDGQLFQICLFLTPTETARLQVTAGSCIVGKVAASNSLWEALAERVFGLRGEEACRGLDGEPTGGRWQEAFKRCYSAARELGLCADGSTQLPQPRWLSLWRRLRGWLSTNLPGVQRTLRRGVDKQEVLTFLSQAGYGPVADSVANLWQVHDGQDAPVQRDLAGQLGLAPLGQEDEWSRGLFGGYTVYDHWVSTIFLPFRSAMKLTKLLKEGVAQMAQRYPTVIAFACSFDFTKILLVDAKDGAVYAYTKRERPLEPVVPQGSMSDGILRWMEEYTRRLEEGIYTAAPLKPEEAPQTIGICLFPACGPEVTRCVTRGVEVTASCIYMPEHRQGWTYSIAFQLLGTKEERGFERCQLSTRHWEIQADDSPPEHVQGEGVIGFFPILTDGGWLLNEASDPNGQYGPPNGFRPGPFRYQSCSGRNYSMRGKFGGELTFVPGTRRHPTGQAFEARMEPFRLYVPDYIY